MKLTKGVRKLAVAGLLGVPALLVACSSGVPKAELDAAKQQAAAEQQKAAALQQQLTAKSAGAADLQKKLADKDKELAEAKKGSLPEGVKPLIWTSVGPTPTRPVPPTPPPPGYVPPTPVPPDAATVNKVFPFTFYVETNTGHQVSELVQNPSCVVTSQFRRGTHLVWRFEVFDTSTGKRVTSLDTDAKVKVVLPNGEEKTARFVRRGGTGPWTWVAAWDVPKDYTLGALDYQIVVTKGNRTGTFDQDDVAIVNKDRKIDSRVVIVE
jgi:hypothetical protein